MIPKKIRQVDAEPFFYDVIEIPFVLTQGEEKVVFSKVLIKNEKDIPLSKKILSVVSPDYFVVKHKDFFEKVKEYIKNQGFSFEVYDINEGGKNNNKFYVDFLLSSYKFTVGDDVWAPFLQGYNCYDKFLSYGIGVGIYNLSDQSSLLIFENILTSKKRHVRKTDIVLDDDIERAAIWVSSIKDIRRRLFELTELEIKDSQEVSNLVKKILGNRKHFKLFNSEGIFDQYVVKYGFTYYSLLTSLMYYVTHAPFKYINRRKYDFSRKLQIRLYNIFIKKWSK